MFLLFFEHRSLLVIFHVERGIIDLSRTVREYVYVQIMYECNMNVMASGSFLNEMNVPTIRYTR